MDETLDYLDRVREVEAKRVPDEVDRFHDRAKRRRDRIKRNEQSNKERF